MKLRKVFRRGHVFAEHWIMTARGDSFQCFDDDHLAEMESLFQGLGVEYVVYKFDRVHGNQA